MRANYISKSKAKRLTTQPCSRCVIDDGLCRNNKGQQKKYQCVYFLHKLKCSFVLLCNNSSKLCLLLFKYLHTNTILLSISGLVPHFHKIPVRGTYLQTKCLTIVFCCLAVRYQDQHVSKRFLQHLRYSAT